MRPLKIRRLPLFSATILLALLGFSSVARASNGIEAVWSFGGGAVAIKSGASGNLQGTVVQETTFAVCPHPVGQLIWSGMRELPDGSFWGRHVWYHGTDCELVPDLGLTAYRVLPTAAGGHILLVCFSNPGDTSQPTIAPNGAVAGATYGCVKSAPLAGVPGSSGSHLSFEELLSLPAATPAPACRRTLTLVPHNPKYDPLKRIVVRIAGKRVAAIAAAEKLRQKIVLGGLPEGQFRFQIDVVTVLKQRFSRTGLYRGCRQKVKLHGAGRPGYS